MVSIEQLKNKIHEEEMKIVAYKVAKQTKKNREKRIAREVMLAGPTEYIDLLREAKVPITVTDIKKEWNSEESKVLQLNEWQEELVNTHALGYMHGLYLRLAVYIPLFCIYMWP